MDVSDTHTHTHTWAADRPKAFSCLLNLYSDGHKVADMMRGFKVLVIVDKRRQQMYVAFREKFLEWTSCFIEEVQTDNLRKCLKNINFRDGVNMEKSWSFAKTFNNEIPDDGVNSLERIIRTRKSITKKADR